jgi:hypothetical protein
VLARFFYYMSAKINKKSIFLSSAIVFVMVFLLLSNLAYASEITASKVIELVNQARGQEGVADLSENETLDEIANDKLGDMIKNNYFAHTSPKGVTPWSWYEKENYDYKYAGENLAINFMTAENQQKAWMNSPTHKKNIMNSQFLEIGVAVGAGEINNQMAIITVQEFGTLSGAAGKASNPKNFSGKEKSNALKDETKITPTVLSVKDESKEDYLDFGKNAKQSVASEKNYFSDVKNYFAKNKSLIFEELQMISAIILFLALVLTPSVFIFEALKSIMINFSFSKIFRSNPAVELK